MYPEFLDYRTRELREEFRRANIGQSRSIHPIGVFRLIQRVTRRAV